MLTIDTLTAGYENENYLGFGYLGSRTNMLASTDPEAPADPALVAKADAALIDYANRNRWTARQLFDWSNSRSGRHFGDVVLHGSGDLDADFAQAVRWGLLDRVSA